MREIASIDYSMTSPCICVGNLEHPDFLSCEFWNLSNLKKCWGEHGPNDHIKIDKNFDLKGIPRFDMISGWAIGVLLSYEIKTVYLEGYSMGSSAGMVFDIGENTGILKYKMMFHDMKIIPVPPTVLKKYWTGKGNAKKSDMESKFIANTSCTTLRSMLHLTDKQENPVSDIIDAYALFRYGCEDIKACR